MRKLKFNEFQKELMSNFKKINEFFLKNNISGWAHSGTLLGAVRNNNIIPGDDDIDMTMTAYEFKKNKKLIINFLEKNNGELFDRNEIFGLDSSRMFSKEKIIIDFNGKEYISKFFIDIMISIPKNKINNSTSLFGAFSNNISFIYGNFYRILPYYGGINNKIIKINGITNFLLFLIRFLIFIFTIGFPIYSISKTKIASKKYSKNVAMFYTYNNKKLIYNLDKINTMVKFGNTSILVSDDGEREIVLGYGKNGNENPSIDLQIPHHFLLTPNNKKLKNKYKISPFIIK